VKHIVGFSGGIDSQAAARWVLNRYPAADVLLCNSNAGQWEDPLTIEFIDTYSTTVHPIVHCNAKVKDIWETPGFAETRGMDGEADLTFETLIQIKGCPPSRKSQFCTLTLKLAPQRRWLRETFGPCGPYAGEDFTRYTGVRRDESHTRKETPIEQWDTWFDCPLVAPLADWTKQMCFDYVKAHGEPINPLYTLGFNRVGCAPCINSSKADIVNWHARRPAMIDKVRGLEQRTGMTFFRSVDRNGIRTDIDEVVRWASTSHGGDQMRLPVLLERHGCESAYGLCE
jgi:3'-phosphoadenosine 5'-phosphosulfate sulfotransferase (PAPS reductase)/FAD synthetase